MDYRTALKAADPIAAAIALLLTVATHTGLLSVVGLTPETALEVAGAMFVLAASVRFALERKKAAEDESGGVLR